MDYSAPATTSREEALHQLYTNALLLRERGEHSKALTVIESILQAAPEWDLALQFKAELLEELGCQDEALTIYRTVLRLNPYARAARTRFTELMAHQKARQLAEAPNGASTHIQALIQRLLSGKAAATSAVPESILKALASKFLDEALELDEQGLTEDALALSSLALRLDPDLAEACNLIGALYEDLGQPGHAVKWYQQAVKLDPDFREAHANLEAIRQALSAQPWVTIARYVSLSEAELARARLEVEGITAQVTNRALANYLGAIVLADPFHLKVPQNEAAIACDILGLEWEEEPSDEDGD